MSNTCVVDLTDKTVAPNKQSEDGHVDLVDLDELASLLACACSKQDDNPYQQA